MIQHYNKEIKFILIISLLKLVILIFLPLTGDEAYFIKWGQNLDWGYYDHPPMVGWLIYLMGYISHSYILFRLFTFFTVFIVALVMYKIAIQYKVDKQKAFFISLLFLSAPIDILIILFTNDVPLLLFGSLGTLFVIYSLERENWLKYSILAGLFLGLGFLSKYFIVFLMFALLIFAFYQYRAKALKPILLACIIVLLFVFENLYYNYNSCWNNIMFNFIARTSQNSYHISTIVGYFGLIIYLMTPWGLYFIVKNKQKFPSGSLLKLISIILMVSFTVFLLVSLKNKIGLHWFILFSPYMYMVYLYLDKSDYKKVFYYNIIFTMVHILLVLLIVFLPNKIFENQKFYNNIILHKYSNDIYIILKKDYGKIYTTNYTTSAILSTVASENIYMLFNTSKYGRMDDKLLDVRRLDNKNIVLFDFSKIAKSKLKQVCQNVEQQDIYIKGAKFYLSKCNNFSYEKYKLHYLTIQQKKFYNIPSWLPIGDCYFKDRYFSK